MRDSKTGAVRSVFGETYMLKAHEELWEMKLPETVVQLLQKQGQAQTDKTRVVTYRVPYNSVTQVYDYKTKNSRVVKGPELVML